MENLENLEANQLRFEEGASFPMPAPAPGFEGATFSVQPYTFMLIYYFNRPTTEEISEFKTGDVELYLTEMKKTLFVLSHFGHLGWCDAPYSSCLTTNLRTLPELSEAHRGYSVDCFLVDAADNVLCAHRLVRMSPDFSKKFKSFLEEDVTKGTTKESFNAAVESVYRNYSTKDLKNFAFGKMKYTSAK